MFRNAARRLGTTALVVLSLLFAQLALASYVCPTGPGQEQAVMEMAPGQPCEGMASDQGQPVLCYHHCTNAPQSSDPGKLPTVSLPAVVQVLVLPVVLDAAAQAVHVPHGAPEAQAPPEPVFLSTRRLRV